MPRSDRVEWPKGARAWASNGSGDNRSEVERPADDRQLVRVTETAAHNGSLMAAGSPSRSAMLTAAARALHRADGPPWVLDDPFAAGLAGEGGDAMVDRVRERLSPVALSGFVHWVALRGRFTEDLVAAAAGEGIDQYVILGAGLDSFAYRHQRLVERLRIFEIDHPASQAWKRARLAELGVTVHPNVVFAAIDFETQTLRQGLSDAGFDFGKPAVFSWIGVTMYLTRSAIEMTLRDIAEGSSGSRLVMTYNQPFQVLDEFSRRVTSELAAAIGEGGEPFISLFSPIEARALLVSAGFVDIADYGRKELQARYVTEAANVQVAGAQRILVASLHKMRRK